MPVIEQMVVLIPVYDDWESVRELLPALDAALDGVAVRARILLVDDGSTQAPPADLCRTAPTRLERVDRLVLRRNLGHQRAIAIGLCYVADHLPTDAVLVMDGDGEDDPADVPRLLARAEQERGTAVVFAERTRRSEHLGFRCGYFLYRVVHRLLTGIRVKVGNFSLIPRPLLDPLVVVSDLWNHYAAAVFKARLPRVGVPTHRARRLRGESRLDGVALVVHGLSAISVFAELAGVRLLLAFGALAAAVFGLLVILVVAGVVAGAAALTTGAIATAVVLLVVLLQVGLFALLACFVTLGARHQAMFVPRRDYPPFIAELRPVHPHE